MEPGSSLSPAVKHLLEKQQYEFIGSHSAVKICGWTKKAIRDEGICYKQKFYGIQSHRCVQMSVAVNFCDMDCIYCWRERHNFPFKDIDDPKELIDNALKAQKKLLSGFGGTEKTSPEKFKEAGSPLHFAISLTGEMLYYPKLGEFIKELNNRSFTSFLVTNGQRPDVLKDLEPPTQLYISLDSPDEETHQKICRSSRDSWFKLLKSLEIMKTLKDRTRTTLRITLIKGLNDFDPEGYAKLIAIADPTYVEVKAYMFVGASRLRLEIENMPKHNEVVEFSDKIAEHSKYKIIDEHEMSRVTLMMKKDVKDRIMKF